MARKVSYTTLLKNKETLESKIVKARRNLPVWEKELESVQARLVTFNSPENLQTVKELAERKKKELENVLGQLKALGVDVSDITGTEDTDSEDTDSEVFEDTDN